MYNDQIEGKIQLSWDVVMGFPAGTLVTYELERNGVVIARPTTLDYLDADLPPEDFTVTYRVRATQAEGGGPGVGLYGPWSNEVIEITPAGAAIIGMPKVGIIVEGKEVDCSNIEAEINITHGTKNFTIQPTPDQARMRFIKAPPWLRDILVVGSVVEVYANSMIRHYGRITDVRLTWEEGVNTQTIEVSTIGPLEQLGWAHVSGTRPVEKDVQRMVWLLTTVYGAQSWAVAPGQETLRLVEYDDVDALDAAEDLTRSTYSRLVELKDGTVCWQDRLTREEAAFFLLDACWIAITAEWVQESEDIVNHGIVTYGPEVDQPEGGAKQNRTEYSRTVDRPWLRRQVTVTTDLEYQQDAFKYAERLVEARTEKEYKLANVVIPVHDSPHWAIWPIVAEGEIGRKVVIAEFPADAPASTMTGYIEGWSERLRWDGWVIDYAVNAETVARMVDEYPPNFKAKPVDFDTIRLTWDEHPRGIAYEIWEKVGEDWVVRARLNAPANTWDHNGLAQDTSHSYKLVRIKNKGHAHDAADSAIPVVIDNSFATARTPAVGSADPVNITYTGAHNGRVRVGLTRPSDADWKDAIVCIKRGSWPTGPNDSQVAVVTGSGQWDWAGPGVQDRPDQTWYVRVWSRNHLGVINYAQIDQASVFFLRSPVEVYPGQKNAQHEDHWEHMNRVRQGRHGTRGGYRGFWTYGTQINDILRGRNVTSCHVLVHRADGGPSGGLQPRFGLHNYTSMPAAMPKPEVHGVRVHPIAVPRWSWAWCDIGADYGNELSNISFGRRGVGLGGADSPNTALEWIGQTVGNDGVLHLRHSDFR
jgi:hypothetical protein